MTIYLSWEKDKQVEVENVAKLDALIDHLHALGRANVPFMVELQANPTTRMSLVVGRAESHVTFHTADTSPALVSAVGPWPDQETITFTHHGQYSEQPKQYWVPIAKARTALRQYYQSGTRPNSLRWQ